MSVCEKGRNSTSITLGSKEPVWAFYSRFALRNTLPPLFTMKILDLSQPQRTCTINKMFLKEITQEY